MLDYPCATCGLYDGMHHGWCLETIERQAERDAMADEWARDVARDQREESDDSETD